MAHGAKLFYLSGLKHGRYLKREVLNLARFISVAKTKPLSWRLGHPYMVADRFEVCTCWIIDVIVQESQRLRCGLALFDCWGGC